jgi:hypothetical protein
MSGEPKDLLRDMAKMKAEIKAAKQFVRRAKFKHYKEAIEGLPWIICTPIVSATVFGLTLYSNPPPEGFNVSQVLLAAVVGVPVGVVLFLLVMFAKELSGMSWSNKDQTPQSEIDAAKHRADSLAYALKQCQEDARGREHGQLSIAAPEDLDGALGLVEDDSDVPRPPGVRDSVWAQNNHALAMRMRLARLPKDQNDG